MSSKDWPSLPLTVVILDILEKHKGIILDNELMSILERVYGDVSPNELNKALLKLEIDGLIHVSYITKTRRKIEILKPGQGYMGVGED
ncbi:MAG: hypothetical protein ACTSSP_08675 [Candidatus Asgardarchaeia archaeon]|nr:hypothetical protein [Candidatus Odinarchaeota archaeon]